MMRPERRFWIELSYRYGMPVRMLKQILPREDYLELLAYELVEPHGEQRADARHGIQTAWIAATMGGVKNPKPSDFIPKWNIVQREKPQTMEDAIRVAIKTTIMLGGTVS